MGKIEKGEVLGCEIDGKIYCNECSSKIEGAIMEDDLITKDDYEDADDLYFCDECKKGL